MTRGRPRHDGHPQGCAVRGRLRGVGAMARLAMLRVAAAPGRWLPAAAAVALAVALPAALAAAAIVGGDHAARRELAAVPSSQRTATLTWNGGAKPDVDRAARAELRGMGG